MINAMFNAFDAMGSEWVMGVLMVLSILSLAVILERYRNLRSQEKVGALLWKEQVESWMKSGTLPEIQAKNLSQKYPCLESALLEVLCAAKSAPSGTHDLSLLMASFLGRKKVDLDKNMSFLGTLGSNAPFIGLFGTVLGIIKAFHDIGSASSGAGGASSVSSSLSEALVATAVGLLVAIPAIIAFNFFQRKIKVIMSRAESLGNFIISNI